MTGPSAGLTPDGPLVVTIDVTEAVSLLEQVHERSQDLRPVLAGPINKSVDTLFLRRFASEGAYGGTPWAPLSPATKRMRATGRGGNRGGILRDTNRLWGSLTKLGLGPEAIRVITPLSLERGTTVPYAKYHQRGWMSVTKPILTRGGRTIFIRRKRPKKIPARQIIPDAIPAELIHTWERVMTGFLTDGGMGL